MTASLNTSHSILRCAQSLIVAGGYNGFSYADIAKVIGIRNASIHHHFPSKADLVRVLVARYREEAAAGMEELARRVPDAPGQLRAYAKYWEACIVDDKAPFCVCALLASELPMLPEEVALEVKAHFRALSGWLASALERGAKQGDFQLAAPAKVEAEIFMATIHGAMLSARAYGNPKMFGAIINPLLKRLASQA